MPLGAVGRRCSDQNGTVVAQVTVCDASDPRLADYVRLTDIHLRRSLEAAHGLFIAEGMKVIRRAMAAGYPVRSFLVAADKLATVADLAADSDGRAPNRYPGGHR